jgi:hypothetical protein
MLRNKLEKLKSFKDAQVSKYFPSVRGSVLLIVIPAFFIVIVYFFSILSEIVQQTSYLSVVESERRLAVVKKDLPVTGVVNYVSTRNEPDDLINAEYALIPVRITEGLKPMHDLLVCQTLDTTEVPDFEGYTLKKNYGNGVLLFARNK